MEHRLPDAPDAPVIEWSTAGGLGDSGGGAADLALLAARRPAVAIDTKRAGDNVVLFDALD